MTVLEISREASQQRPSLEPFQEHVAWSEDNHLFLAPEGQEHYRMLAHIAATMAMGECLRHDPLRTGDSMRNGVPREPLKIADVGTFKGYSAIALASVGADKVHVTTYDIMDCMPPPPAPSAKTLPNIAFRMMNCFDDMDAICKCDLISLDIDPHDGLQERRFVDALTAAGYKGVLFCDDIHLCQGMSQFWASIKQQKYDVTRASHWSGSGIVIFDPSRHQVRGYDAMLTV